jgi:tetratricopeptide (TPR) repeat protein
MELANYYQKRDNREKAVELLRPLAQANVPGTRANLADLDASWGDELLRSGKLEDALRCWEEVAELKTGSRASEAPARLTTIYQKLATSLASDNNTSNDADALKYLNKLNAISENPKSLEMAGDLQQKSGQLDDAIASLRKASSLDGNNHKIAAKLAKLLKRRGQEMLDQGNDEGNQYLQEASGLSTTRNTDPDSDQPVRQTAVPETRVNQTPQPEIKEITTKNPSKANATADGGYRVMTPPERSTPVKSADQPKSTESSSSSEKPLEMRLLDEDPSLSSPQEQH